MSHDLLILGLLTQVAIAVVVITSLAYCLWLLVVAAFASRRLAGSHASCIAPAPDRATQFCILIPAHNEELLIRTVLEHVAASAYDRASVRVIVVADNCTDATAEIASSIAGVEVWLRRDLTQAGKPHALNWAMARLRRDGNFDAVVIMDADTFIDPGFLAAMHGAFVDAGGVNFAAQGWYSVLNADETWRTCLMAGALGLVHYVRPLAREELGLSAGLKGNGMCFSKDLIYEISWRGESLTEDIEMGLDLIEKLGVRVRFVPGAIVRAQMPASKAASASQRRRWEHGRYEIVRRRAAPMFLRAVMRGDRRAGDMAFDLLLPPVVELGTLLVIWCALAAAVWFGGLHSRAMPTACAAAVAGFIAYVLGGFRVSKAPADAYGALVVAPVYMIWKLFTILQPGRSSRRWVRTERNRPAGDAVEPVDEAIEATRK